MPTSVKFLLLLTLTATFARNQVYASERLELAFDQQEAASKIAAFVAATVRQAGEPRQAFVRGFRGLGEDNVGLSKLISESLKHTHRFAIQRGLPIEIEGRVQRKPRDLAQPLEGYTISSTIILPNSSERNFSISVENREEGHIIVGRSGEKAAPPTKPHGTIPDRQGPVLDGTIIRPSKDNPYGVEFFVERHGTYQAVVPVIEHGNVSVSVHQGDLVGFRLHNSSGFEAAVGVLIDGLSRFAVSDEPNKEKSLDLVPHGKPRLIKGYYRDHAHVDAFRVGEYSKSVVAELLPDSEETGTATLVFRAAWAEGEQEPPNESPSTKRSVAMERGPELKDKTRTVKRVIGDVRAVVKIFYGG